MNRISKLAVVTILLALNACKNSNETKTVIEEFPEVETLENPTVFKIEGSVKGLTDGQLITLRDLELNTVIDSCMVKNGQIFFKGAVQSDPIQAVLRIYDSVGSKEVIDYNSFYLDNANYEFTTTKENFKHAYLKGSEVNDDFNTLKAQKLPFFRVVDSIQNLFWNSTTKLTKEQQEEGGKLLHNAQIEMSKIDSTFLYTRTNSYPALSILQQKVNRFVAGKKMDMKGADKLEIQLKSLYNRLNDDFKQTEKGKAIYTQLFVEKIEEGSAYFPLENTKTMGGQPFDMASITTEYVLLEFTSVYCGPCKKFRKEFAPYYEKFKDKMTIVYFQTDTDKEVILKDMEKNQLPGVVVSDFQGLKGMNAKRYNITGIPDFFLLDKDRKVIRHIYGYDKEVKEEFLSLLNIKQ